MRHFWQQGGVTQAQLAAQFSTSVSTVSRVINGKVHRQRPLRKLSDEQVQELRFRVRTELRPLRDFAEEYELPVSNVHAITHGRAYCDVPLSDRELQLCIDVYRAAWLAADIPANRPLALLAGSRESVDTGDPV